LGGGIANQFSLPRFQINVHSYYLLPLCLKHQIRNMFNPKCFPCKALFTHTHTHTHSKHIDLRGGNYRSICGSRAVVDLGRFFIFLIYTHLVGLLGQGISPSQGRYLHTRQHKHRINAHRHQCLEWDSNPQPQCSSGRRRFVPKTAWPL
jgi:hypothetical protein